MLRILRALDTVLETLIFDVAFGTSRRRRCIAALAALAFYGLCGLVFVPVVQHTEEPVDSRPYLAESPGDVPLLISDVAHTQRIPEGRDGELEKALRTYDHESAQLVGMLAPERPPAFPLTPSYRRVHEAATVLDARGVWFALHGQGDAAMLQWITALRLARLVARGTATRPPVLIEGLVACSMERQTLDALGWYGSSRMTSAQWQLLQGELRLRQQFPHSLRFYMEGERAYAQYFFRQAHRDGGIAEGEQGIYLSRTLMPLRHADRAAFMDEVRDRFLEAFDADLAGIHGNTAAAAHEAFPTDYALPLAPFFHHHAVRRMADLIFWSTHPNTVGAGERLEQVEKQARALENTMLDLEGI